MRTKLAKSPVDGYDHSSVQINAPDTLCEMLAAFNKKFIPDSVLFKEDDGSKGREDDNGYHVTVLYGLTEDTEVILPKLKDLLAKVKPFKVKLGVISRFNSSPRYDVIKFEVGSDALTELNRTLRNAFDFESDYDKFKPHITLAYVRKGFLVDLSGNTDFVGTPFNVDAVTFSGKEKSGKTVIHLEG